MIEKKRTCSEKEYAYMVHRGCGRNVEHRVGFIYLLELGLEEATSDEAAKHKGNAGRAPIQPLDHSRLAHGVKILPELLNAYPGQ